jgi:hypothetical protein
MALTGKIRPFACALSAFGLLAVAACGPSRDRQAAADKPDDSATTEAVTQQVASAMPEAAQTAPTLASATGPLSCADEIGATAAQKRADLCRNVSPATHPPCNVANSCAMIEDEIARSCAMTGADEKPMAGCKPDPRSKEAAAAVVQRYYSALNARDFGTAWQQWGENGPPNQTPEKFRAGFAHTRATHVVIGALQPGDAGAGSIYQPVPVTVDATLDNGTHQRFRGTYVVRRVNDVDGASAAQLRWHIDSAKLAPAP